MVRHAKSVKISKSLLWAPKISTKTRKSNSIQIRHKTAYTAQTKNETTLYLVTNNHGQLVYMLINMNSAVHPLLHAQTKQISCIDSPKICWWKKSTSTLVVFCISALGARSLYLCVNIVIYIFKRVPLSPWGENCIMNIQRVAIRFICHLGFQINTISPSPPSSRGYLENKEDWERRC